MAKRLAVLAGHFSGGEGVGLSAAAGGGYPGFTQATPSTHAFPGPSHDIFASDDLLTDDEKAVRARVRDFAETHIAPVAADFWERAEFPHSLVHPLGDLNVAGLTINGYGSPGLSPTAAGLVLCELARVDASISTFVLVHSSLAALTISEMGSEEQKQKYLPGLAKLRLVGCWALTEPGQGSDAAALQTTATKVDGGWILSGQKRWIGNGTFADVTVVWAKDTATNKVNAFIVEKGTAGHRTAKIENKISLRCVQNADITLTRCFVPDSARLPGVTSFADTAKVLKTSRVMVAWMPVGIAMGAYDMAHRYLIEREQFGAPLAGLAINQVKLMRMLGAVQASFLLVLRLTRLREQGRMTPGMSSLVKGWVTQQCREAVALGRELLGGNGIVADFHIAKAFCDLEAIYTYEGTYDINMLVAGRETTGLSAFRPQVSSASPN